MNRSLLIAVAVLVLGGLAVVDSAPAVEYAPGGCYGQTGYAWHGGYYNVAWGVPVALVVPPTAKTQYNFGWGVGGTYISHVYPQFGRNWPGPVRYDPRAFRPTPRWPSHTDQFGIYYVRGPW
ncbi:MAG: hypothetical protein ACYSWU_08085 [Planctomycetota bacterium]|jgi:hypothetical protein